MKDIFCTSDYWKSIFIPLRSGCVIPETIQVSPQTVKTAILFDYVFPAIIREIAMTIKSSHINCLPLTIVYQTADVPFPVCIMAASITY